MIVDLYAKTNARPDSFYAGLKLPATQAEIRDAMQRARMAGDARILSLEIEVDNCNEVGCLSDVGLYKPTIDEVNFFAKRLQQLSSEDHFLLNAVIAGRHKSGQYKDGIPMKELINLTYGLDQYSVIEGIRDVNLLGRYVIAHGLLSSIVDVPKEMYRLFAPNAVGEMWQEKNGGVFWWNDYIANGNSTPPEVTANRQPVVYNCCLK